MVPKFILTVIICHVVTTSVNGDSILDVKDLNLYPKNEISIVCGYPDLIGFKYSRRISVFSIGTKPGLLSLVYGKFSDNFDWVYAPSIYLDYAFKTKHGYNTGFIDHKIELSCTPYFDTYKEFEYSNVIVPAIRYLFQKTWVKWRLNFTVGLSLLLNFNKPDPDLPTIYIPIFPLPGGSLSIGRVF